MQTRANKSRDSRGVAVADRSAVSKHAGDTAVMLVDNSPESLQLSKLQLMADNSPQAKEAAQLQAMADGSPDSTAQRLLQEGLFGVPVQKQEVPEEEELQLKAGPSTLQLQSEEVEEENPKPGTSSYAEVSGWIHIALDAAGLAPGLGVFPDAVNAVYYLIEGDWVNAGISAAAMVPVFGQGATATKYGVKVTKEAAERLGKEGIEQGLKKAAQKEAAEKATKEAAKKALKKRIAGCEAIWAAYKAIGPCRSCKADDTKAERAAKIACLGVVIAGRDKYLKEKCDYVLPGSIAKGSAIAEKGHKIQVTQEIIRLAKCSTLPTI